MGGQTGSPTVTPRHRRGQLLCWRLPPCWHATDFSPHESRLVRPQFHSENRLAYDGSAAFNSAGGLAKGPNFYPDGSIARLDTLLSHELPHVYGLIYENGVPMSELRAMTIENQYRASKGYEYSDPCIGRGYCD